MLKLTSAINVLMILTIFLFFNPNNNSIAGTCDEKSSSGNTPTFTGDHNYTENWHPELQFQYDPSNPDEIDRNSSISLNVIGGCSPYTWSVSGTGFTLDEEITTGLTNTLNADGAPCGSATITVTGCNETQVVGYVRSTSGKWVLSTSCGGTFGPINCDGCLPLGCYGMIDSKTAYFEAWCGYSDDYTCEELGGCVGPCSPIGNCSGDIIAGYIPCSVGRTATCEWVCAGDPRPNCTFTP